MKFVIRNEGKILLYTLEDITAGDGSLPRCRNWSSLLEFATQLTTWSLYFLATILHVMMKVLVGLGKPNRNNFFYYV